MVKKQDPSQIYKWSAMALTLLVAGYIVFSFSRQALFNKTLTALTRQRILPATNSSPGPSPQYTIPKGTESWSSYVHPAQKFTVRLPEGVKVDLVSSDGVSFVKEDAKQAVLMKLDIRRLTEQRGLDILPKPRDENALIDKLFTSNVGVVNITKTSPNSQIILKKKSIEKINGLSSVYFSDYFISQSVQDPSHYVNHYLIKSGEDYYLLSQGGEHSESNLKSYEDIFKLFASSFTLY